MLGILLSAPGIARAMMFIVINKSNPRIRIIIESYNLR